MLTTEFCVVITTFENEEQAEPMIKAVLEEQLAACIQTAPIDSHYYWNGGIQHDKELLVLLKTRRDLYQPLKELISKLHPYKVPEIIAIDIGGLSRSYQDWIREVTRTVSRGVDQ